MFSHHLCLLVCFVFQESADNSATTTPAAPPTVSSSTPEPGESPTRQQLAADDRRTTPDGATFVAPGGWWIETRDSAVILTPEGDSLIALVDVGLQDADEAVKAAWQAVRPERNWPLKLATDRPGREGWDSFRNYEYEVSPNEHRAVAARAAKRGDAYTVILFDMDLAVAGKRGGEIAKVYDSFQPPGFERESFADAKANCLDADRIETIKNFIESGRDLLGIPGVAIGLYQEGEIVFEGGFGVRELGSPTPVDADTLFLVASNTKSMTTLLLATLIDEGKLTWDTPVTEVMPLFKLGDPATTQQVLIKHLVCACTGLPRQDLEWLLEFHSATPQSELDLLGTFQPTSKFGEMFQYSNLLAAAGGFVAAHMIHPDRELGAAYDDAMAQRVFDPIGMSSTTFDFAEALAGNHASPHGWDVDGETSAASMAINYSVVPLRPAGGAWSSATDMMRYLRMELDKGALPNGQRVASESGVVKRREPQIMVGNDGAYGMGLQVDRRWGIPVVHHGGSLIGYKSDMIYLPDHDVAAVILTNSDEGGLLIGPFRRRLLEVLFDGNPEAEENVATAAENMRAAVLEERKRLTIPADVAADTIAPAYSNAALGEIAVVREGEETWLDFGEWKTVVASRQNDDGTVALVTASPGFTGLPLVIGNQDGDRTLTLRDAQHEYVFVEQKDPGLADARE